MEQIRPLTALSKDELIARIEQYEEVQNLRDAEIRELHEANDKLRALIEADQAGLAHQEQLIIRQRNVILQQESLMDAIGAGGVSGQRITDDGALQALQACEKAYHRMIVGGTPQDCRAHDAARVAFWRVFGGGQS